jgi:hypothetical protein
MPKVVVYVRSRDWRLLEQTYEDPGPWVRERVAEAIAALRARGHSIPGARLENLQDTDDGWRDDV